jgi:hypothetical protein
MRLYRAVYVGQNSAVKALWAENGFCVAQDFGEMAEIIIGKEYMLVPKNDLKPLPDKEHITIVAEEYSEPLSLPPEDLIHYVDGKDIEWLLENPSDFSLEQISCAFIWLGRVLFHSTQNTELSPTLLSTEWSYARKSVPVFMKLLEALK